MFLCFSDRCVLSVSYICHIVSALGFGNNISLRSQLQIGIFNGSAAQLQFLRTFSKRGHPASGRGTTLQNTFFLIIICNMIHYFSTPYLMIKNALLKLNTSWEATAKLLGDSWGHRTSNGLYRRGRMEADGRIRIPLFPQGVDDCRAGFDPGAFL